jgi:hypothetical protein
MLMPIGLTHSCVAAFELADGGEYLLDLGGARHLVGVGAPRASDGLQDEREADLLRYLSYFGCSMHAS